MIQIDSSIPHRLGKTVATDRMFGLVSTLTQRFPQQVHQVQWYQNEQLMDVQFAAYGYVVHWRAEIGETSVDLHGEIPDSAKPYRRKIEQAIIDRVESTLQPALSKAA